MKFYQKIKMILTAVYRGGSPIAVDGHQSLWATTVGV
jgi:hypothetical protein